MWSQIDPWLYIKLEYYKKFLESLLSTANMVYLADNHDYTCLNIENLVVQVHPFSTYCNARIYQIRRSVCNTLISPKLEVRKIKICL